MRCLPITWNRWVCLFPLDRGIVFCSATFWECFLNAPSSWSPTLRQFACLGQPLSCVIPPHGRQERHTNFLGRNDGSFWEIFRGDTPCTSPVPSEMINFGPETKGSPQWILPALPGLARVLVKVKLLSRMCFLACWCCMSLPRFKILLKFAKSLTLGLSLNIHSLPGFFSFLVPSSSLVSSSPEIILLVFLDPPMG